MATRIFFGIFKFAVAVFAWLLIVVGVILTPSPIPFGIIFIAIGLALMVAVAPDVSACARLVAGSSRDW